MMILSLPSASTFSGDVDGLVDLVSWMVGIWFFATQIMFFWLLWRFRARPGVKSQYVTGKEPHLKRWINIPHALVLLCDIVIIIAAVRVWVKVKQR
jgi:cytochrome c oxidase subunit 2